MLIVLVGVRGAGKTTLLEGLKPGVTVLKPTTTRAKRSTADTEYQFVTTWDANKYVWGIPVGLNTYGMRITELAKAQRRVCATVFEPMQIARFEAARASFAFESFTVGLDTITDLAEQHARVGNNPSRIMSQEDFGKATEAVRHCDVVLRGNAATVEEALKVYLEILAGKGGLIVKDQITRLIAASTLLEDADPKNAQPASYDLRLGDHLWCGGQLIELTDQEPRFSIPPYSYAIVSALEIASLPPFLVGRFDLRVGYFFEGIILSNGPQVDPGYKGALFCMLYNGSGRPKLLKRAGHFATIDFTTTQRIAESYKEKNQFKHQIDSFMSDDALTAHGGAIVQLIDTKIAMVSRKVKGITNSFWGIAAACLAITVATPTVGFWILSTRLADIDRRMEKLDNIERRLRDLPRGADAFDARSSSQPLKSLPTAAGQPHLPSPDQSRVANAAR
jgi:deoxycytidine triphosphate deaminase